MPASTTRARFRLMALSAIGVVAILTVVGFTGRLHAATRLQAAPPAPASATPVRLVVMVFDVTAMSPDDVRRAAAAAAKSFDTFGPSDLVSIVTLSPAVRVMTDFTADRAVARAVLESNEFLNASTASVTPQPADGTRLGAIASICETLSPIAQQKAMMYFSGGLARDGSDQAQLNAATNACRRGNVLLYPVDARGLGAAQRGLLRP